ncbi:SDR family NAD(P)-dependent oxidoreductase [Rubripirellula lacrimiformis]|uniref:SDR family NAD(P)-dependent oxidoreductase n=1 Tax=Rubripirellula lacrimiformis TaxID=1930273 RepID=UPI0028F45628|nr:SDR family oxidoreductase [Rubripirellula lacrimiformis]
MLRRVVLLIGALKGTSAVVTGASSGIGRAIAVRLASEGASRVVIHYRSNESGASQTADLVRQAGADPVLIAADLGDTSDCSRLVDDCFGQLGAIQTWVNNAGADVLTGAAGQWTFEEKLRRLIDVDFVGTVCMSRLAGPRMASQQLPSPPAMIFLGWDQSTEGMEGDAGQMFGPVKAAVTAYAKSLAQTLAPQVRVNCVAPGWIQTSWGETTSDYWNDRATGQALMHRWGRPEDIAAAVAYLADPSNSFVTGQVIQVNGGWNRRFPTD